MTRLSSNFQLVLLLHACHPSRTTNIGTDIDEITDPSVIGELVSHRSLPNAYPAVCNALVVREKRNAGQAEDLRLSSGKRERQDA